MAMLLANPVLLFYVILRPLGMCLIFPLLGSRNLGNTVIRNGFILAVAIPAIPLYLGANPVVSVSQAGVTFIFQEIVIGALIGFVVALPFWALDSAGFIIDTIRGSSMGTVLNPSLGEAASVLGIIFVQLFIALFFMYGGLNHVLSILYRSWQIIPPGTPLVPGKAWLELLLAQWHTMLTLCVGFSLPSVTVMVLTDLAIGLMNRSAQQLNVFFLAMPIKSVMALLMLVTSLTFAFKVFFSHLDALPEHIDQLLELMVP
ncbi:MAG: type III secretion system export apparatus subunit SctT [Kluyvera sp.]|uniref:type III secretion system export apparatus subunit SctT n=1 Tax=Kluyvera sp. TaxID=1538228 RepID=UPI003F2A185B